MDEHRHALCLFLRTDQHRLEAALVDARWGPTLATRLSDHLRFTTQVRAVYLEGIHPLDPALQTELAALSLTGIDDTLAKLEAGYAALRAAIQGASDARLQAPVLDPHERGLSVLGHLYDLCRVSAMLVEWARHLPPDEDESLEGWGQ